MHVLIPVLHRPIKPTGVCRHAVNIAQCLAETNEVSRVTLLIGEWQNEYFEQSFNLDSPKIQTVSIVVKRGAAARNIWYLNGLPKVANKLKPDIIHMSFPFPFLRSRFEAPIVCSSIHDLYPFEYPENFGYPQVWFNQWFLKQSINSSDGLACVSKVTLDKLHHFFSRKDKDLEKEVQTQAVVYNYVDFSTVELQRPATIDTETYKPFILSVAQHRKNKNLDLLIRAHKALIKSGSVSADAQLILVGSNGPETEGLHQLVEALDLRSQVIFLSALSDGELCWLYQNCELFVIPSSTEGFCLPLVEALAWSSKVVCSDIPIFQEVGSSSCTYFDVATESATILSETMKVAISAKQPTDICPDLRFSKGHVARQLLTFYTSINKSHG